MSSIPFMIRSLSLVAVVAACGSPASSERAHALVEEGASLVDVRTPGEFAAGHVEGAVNIPISELEGRVSEIPEEAPVVVYCLSGGRSARAARLLESRGYEVHDLGAMSNW